MLQLPAWRRERRGHEPGPDVVKRSAVLVGVAVAVLATVTAGGVILVFGKDSSAGPTRTEYFREVADICRVFGPKLDRIRPPDASGTGDVVAAIRLALPLIKAQERKVKELDAPTELRAKLARWFDLQDRRIVMLERALRAARRQDYLAVGVAYTDFTLSGPAIARLGEEIGVPHPPC